MLTDQQLAQFIARFPNDISDTFRNDAQENLSVIEFKKGEILLDKNTTTPKGYVILKGSFVRYIVTPNGNEKAVMFHTENFIQAVANVVDPDDSLVTFFTKANENSEVIKIDFSFSLKWLSTDIIYNKSTAEDRLKYLATINQIQNHLIGLTSEEFLKWLYHKYGFLFQRFSSKDIANFMGITPVWLSTLKSKLLKP